MKINNKYDFIIELLEQKKLNSFQKERILKLTSLEIKKEQNNDDSIIKRIKSIEEKLKLFGGSKDTDLNSKITETKYKDPFNKYKDPKNLTRFLIAFNQDPILKYTCHEIDDDNIVNEINKKCKTDKYNLIKHQEIILRSFKELTKTHKVNKKIYALISTYLGGMKGKWSSEGVEINWKSSELIEWSKINPGIVPHPGQNLINKFQNKGFTFKAFRSVLTGERIRSFSEIVIHFKNLFHLRADNSLKSIILNINKQWDEKVQFEIADFWENIELFTDTDKLIQTYNKIIDLILSIDNGTKPIVKLSFKEYDGSIIFSIHHINSVYKKTITNIIDRLGEKYTDLIDKQINGVCDLYLRADFDNKQFAEINLWNGKKRESKEFKEFKGVEHILKF